MRDPYDTGPCSLSNLSSLYSRGSFGLCLNGVSRRTLAHLGYLVVRGARFIGFRSRGIDCRQGMTAAAQVQKVCHDIKNCELGIMASLSCLYLRVDLTLRTTLDIFSLACAVHYSTKHFSEPAFKGSLSPTSKGRKSVLIFVDPALLNLERVLPDSIIRGGSVADV